MPFDDDVREPDFDPPPPKAETHSFPVPPGTFERAAMADFCESLSPEDWLSLEGLGPRLRNALLKQTVQIVLRWRKRRARKAETVKEKDHA